MNTIFIGIAGGTGSGKTTLTEHLAARFGSDISVVHHDNYYKRQDRPFAERCLHASAATSVWYTTTTTTSGRTGPSPSAACKTTTIPTPSTPT